MKKHRGITPATRLSIALALVTMSMVFLAEAIGLMPGQNSASADARLRLAEALALQLTVVSQNATYADLETLAVSIVERHPDLKSLALRDLESQLILETAGHSLRWREETKDPSALARIELPLFAGDKARGMAELAFEPIARASILSRGSRVAMFIALAGFLLYRTYLRRVLKYLDPSSVIPERVKVMLDTMAEGVIVLDDRERIVLANQAFLMASGHDLHELQGRKASHIPWQTADGKTPSIYPWSADDSTARGIELHLKRDGCEPQIFMVNCTPISAAEGTSKGTLATFDDVTAIEAKNIKLERMVHELDTVRLKVQKQNEELRLLASRDSLTNTLNRRALFERLESDWSSSERYKHGLACVMMDIDNFKAINDVHGHAMGDQILQHVAGLLKSQTRTSDVVGRYGGEEFCILLPHTEIEEAETVAENLRNTIERERFEDILVTASFGISSIALGATDPQYMVDEADKALYVAKRSGRNRAVRWDQVTEADLVGVDAGVRPDESLASDTTPIPFHAVLSLTAALSHRDPATAAHSRRVAELCMLVSEGMMSSRDRFILEVAALLHDIGKIGVPDAILLKPGPLTEDEWRIMETHDQMGIEIINSAFSCTELTNIVRYHHARFAGSRSHPGMPVGPAIPLRARILTIADAYDAMVSDRVYRKAMSQADAFAELRRCAGTQFDPDLTERFIEAISSHDEGHPTANPASDAAEFAQSLGIASERITAAIDAGDMKMLTAVTEHLRTVAKKHDWSRIVEMASKLGTAVDSGFDLEDVLNTTRDLLEICHSTQSEILAPADAAAREAA